MTPLPPPVLIVTTPPVLPKIASSRFVFGQATSTPATTSSQFAVVRFQVPAPPPRKLPVKAGSHCSSAALLDEPSSAAQIAAADESFESDFESGRTNWAGRDGIK